MNQSIIKVEAYPECNKWGWYPSREGVGGGGYLTEQCDVDPMEIVILMLSFAFKQWLLYLILALSSQTGRGLHQHHLMLDTPLVGSTILWSEANNCYEVTKSPKDKERQNFVMKITPNQRPTRFLRFIRVMQTKRAEVRDKALGNISLKIKLKAGILGEN